MKMNKINSIGSKVISGEFDYLDSMELCIDSATFRDYRHLKRGECAKVFRLDYRDDSCAYIFRTEVGRVRSFRLKRDAITSYNKFVATNGGNMTEIQIISCKIDTNKIHILKYEKYVLDAVKQFDVSPANQTAISRKIAAHKRKLTAHKQENVRLTKIFEALKLKV